VTRPRLRVKRLCDSASLPVYATAAAAGLDLASALPDRITLEPGRRVLVPTGLSVELPPGHEGQVRPRSGLAVKHGVTVLNAPGTIDEDYRGEVKVALVNLGEDPVCIDPGMRIAQLVVAPVTRVKVEEVAELAVTARGEGGFGHTGD